MFLAALDREARLNGEQPQVPPDPWALISQRSRDPDMVVLEATSATIANYYAANPAGSALANNGPLRSFFNGDYGQAALTAPLNSIFDGYRGQSTPFDAGDRLSANFGIDASAVEEDKIGIEGAIKFFEDIGVQLDEIACIAIAELCRCPSMGEFTRQGFVSGWRSVK